MKSIQLVLLLLVCIAYASVAKVGLTSARGAIKLSGLNDKFIKTPAPSLDTVLRPRGGAITDTLMQNVMQGSNSLVAASATVSSFLQQYLVSPWMSTPPMTQLFVGLSFLATSLMAIFNNNEWPEELHFDLEKTFQEFQLWRPFTSFLHLGSFGFSYLLTLQFVWMYMSQLEKLMVKTPAEYLVMMLFGGLSLIGSYLAFDLPTNFLGHNLAAYLVYIWSKVFEGNDINLMDLITMKAEYLPWFFAAQTLILEGDIPLMDLIGIGIGYVYQLLKENTKILGFPAQWLESTLFALPWVKSLYAGTIARD